MRNLLLTALFIIGSTFLSNAQQKNEVVIKGKTDGIKEGILHVIIQKSLDEVDTLSSTPFNKSRFKINYEISEPMVTNIMLDGYQGGFTMIAEPGAKYDAFLSNSDKSYIKGGTFNDAYNSHLHKSDSMRNRINEIEVRYADLRKNNKFRSASATNDTLRREKELLRNMTAEFLSSNDNLITAYTMYSNIAMREMGLNESRSIYENMGEEAKRSQYGRLIKERIERLEDTAKNAPAPDFTLADPDGNEVTMSKVPGKIKIIDFWASWCGPCRMNNPSLRKLYEEFHDKGLEIIGVSLDNKPDKWKGAIEKDGLKWINISSLKGWQCEVARKYNVKGIPALFVLDENNRIIASELRGEALRTFIQERLK